MGPRDPPVEAIKAEEGFRRHPYTDTRGTLTIGYGTDISEGITRAEAETLLLGRLSSTQAALRRRLEGWSGFPHSTRDALTDMGYQLGPLGVARFTDMLAALRAGDCATAKAAALDSQWARETPQRARRVTDSLCDD